MTGVVPRPPAGGQGRTLSPLAAVPLHFDTRAAYLAVVFANAVAAAASAVLAARLPRRTASAPARPSATAGWVALRDRPYMRVAVMCGLLATYHSLLTIALPLW